MVLNRNNMEKHGIPDLINSVRYWFVMWGREKDCEIVAWSEDAERCGLREAVLWWISDLLLVVFLYKPICNLHLCGVTSRSRFFWERFGQIAIISLRSSASIWCLSAPPESVWCQGRVYTHVSKHIRIDKQNMQIHQKHKHHKNIIIITFIQKIHTQTHRKCCFG